MKIKFFLLLGVLVLSLFTFVTSASAWPGCCSHHDGVCGCGCCDGTALSAKCAPHYPECNQGTQLETPRVYPTIVLPTRIIPTRKPTRIPTSTPKCAAVSDGYCPAKNCSAGSDPDCCNAQKNNYKWYENWGCYPAQLSCSGKADGVCDWYCGAGNDADCCNQQNNGYQWYENWGCYPKQ